MHVPFLLGAVAVIAGEVLLRTVRPALDAAEAASIGTSHQRTDTVDAVTDVPEHRRAGRARRLRAADRPRVHHPARVEGGERGSGPGEAIAEFGRLDHLDLRAETQQHGFGLDQ